MAPYSRLTLKTGRSETATRQIKQKLQRGNSWRRKSRNITNETNDKPDDSSLEVDTDKTLLPSSLCHLDPFTPYKLLSIESCQRKILIKISSSDKFRRNRSSSEDIPDEVRVETS